MNKINNVKKRMMLGELELFMIGPGNKYLISCPRRKQKNNEWKQS